MIESAVHRWGLIVLVTAAILSAGLGDGVWRWGALLAGVPAIVVFHGAMTLLEKRRQSGGGPAGAAAARPGEEPGA